MRNKTAMFLIAELTLLLPIAFGSIVHVQGQSALSVSVLPPSVVMDVSQSKIFTTSVTGGVPSINGYLYQWYLNDAPVCKYAMGQNWTFTPTMPGSYTVDVEVTDIYGNKAMSNTATVTVNSQPFVTVSPSSLRGFERVLGVGESQTFTANATGGTPPYSYQWFQSIDWAPLTLASTAQTYTFTADSETYYNNVSASKIQSYVSVTDSVGGHTPIVSEEYSAVDIYVIGSGNPFYGFAVVSPSWAFLNVGQSQTFTISVTGGVPPINCYWSIESEIGQVVASGLGSTFTFTPTTEGRFNAFGNYINSEVPGATCAFPAEIRVGSAPLSVSVSPDSAVVDFGQSLTFNANATGGFTDFPYTDLFRKVPIYLYQWRVNGIPVSGATGQDWTFMPTMPGSYIVDVEVTDIYGNKATSNTATVTALVLSVSVSPHPVAMILGGTQIFTANATGGIPPYSYQWYLNNTAVSDATNSTWTFTPASYGYCAVYSKVFDSVDGRMASNLVPVTVAIFSNISCLLYSSSFTIGDSVTVYGSISPAVTGKNVTLEFKKPDGTTVKRTVTTGSDGSYSDSYTPDVAGSWNVSASWDGDTLHRGAFSSTISFLVIILSFFETTFGLTIISGGIIAAAIIAIFVFKSRIPTEVVKKILEELWKKKPQQPQTKPANSTLCSTTNVKTVHMDSKFINLFS